MKRIKNLTSAVFLLTLLIAAGCQKESNPVPGDKDIDHLVISPHFKYETSKPIHVTVTLPYTVDYSSINGKVEIFYLFQDSLRIVYTGLCDTKGVLNATVSVPSFVKELYVKTLAGIKTIDLGKTLKSSLEGGYSVNFGNDIDTLPPRTIGALKFSQLALIESEPNFYYSGWLKSSSNLISNGTFDINDFRAAPTWSSPMPIDGRWYTTNEITGKAGRAIDPTGTSGNNYVLKISSQGFTYGGVSQMIPASAGQLIVATGKYKTGGLPAQKYGWIYLIPYNAGGNPLAYYSVINQSNPTQWTTLTVSATMPAGTAKCQVLLWVNNYGGDIYYDDIVVTGPNPDSDKDGVIDAEDEYPNDPQRAFNYYYPSNNTYSTLAFEDNWPYKADYDFNDLVIDQRYKFVLNGKQQMVDIYGDFIVRAIGASYKNGFGFKLNVLPNAIQSVSGQSITQNYITLNSNGTEAGQEKAVIIVTDNVFKQLPHPGTGTGVNTTPGAPYVQPQQQTIHIAFNNPVSIGELNNPLVNPFLIVNQNRGREIHLIDNPPTTLANLDYFNTGADASNLAAGGYYKTANNLPWAIELPVSFEYTIEKEKITNAYLKFANWAETAGNDYSDWYIATDQGYRDNSKIYSHGSK